MKHVATRLGMAAARVGIWTLVLACGCAAPSGRRAPREVAAAWQNENGHDRNAREADVSDPAAGGQRESDPRTEATADAEAGRGGEGAAEAIATINGRPLPAYRIINTLLQNHGAALLEQHVASMAAEEEAARRGIAVSAADIEREYELTLRRLYDPLAGINGASFDRAAAERLVDEVLAERRSSREELRLVVRRNAFLRKIAAAEVEITDERLRLEHERLNGERVQVRHIQLATLAQVERARAEMRAGLPFEVAAQQFSANTGSAGRGGLLEPFTAVDERVPAAFRTAAWALQPGEESAPVRVGQWLHLIRMERRIPGQAAPLEAARENLAAALRERLAEESMESLFSRLVAQADVKIRHPVLREAYERLGRERGAAGGD